MILCKSKTSKSRSVLIFVKSKWPWCLCICALVLMWPVQVVHDARTRIPKTSPTTLAHAIADFNNHRELFDNIGSWVIEDESNNYTSWRYEVRYTCGARCRGRALVMLHEELPEGGREGLRHGHSAQLLRLYVAHEQCNSLPLLPWPRICEDWVMWAELRASSSGGDSTDYWERAAQRCTLAATLMGYCGPTLRRQQAHRVQSIRTLINVDTYNRYT